MVVYSMRAVHRISCYACIKPDVRIFTGTRNFYKVELLRSRDEVRPRRWRLPARLLPRATINITLTVEHRVNIFMDQGHDQLYTSTSTHYSTVPIYTVCTYSSANSRLGPAQIKYTSYAPLQDHSDPRLNMSQFPFTTSHACRLLVLLATEIVPLREFPQLRHEALLKLGRRVLVPGDSYYGHA